jgi:hypothetical protein
MRHRYMKTVPKDRIMYIHENRVTEEPIIDIFFVSWASYKRFLQANPLIKKKIGKEYFVTGLLYSHMDCRAT